jgi:hypothetical protein
MNLKRLAQVRSRQISPLPRRPPIAANIAKLPELVQKLVQSVGKAKALSVPRAPIDDLCHPFRRVILQFKFSCLPL